MNGIINWGLAMKLIELETKQQRWTNDELKNLIQTLKKSNRNGLELEYFDEETIEHLTEGYLIFQNGLIK